MDKSTFLATAIVASCLLASCASSRPENFQQATTSSSKWFAGELPQNCNYASAWRDVFDIVVKEFDLDIFSREEGFIQTQWNSSTSRDTNYQTRVKIRFSKDKKAIFVSCEGRFRANDQWHIGVDKQLQDNLKSDLQGILGRTIR